MRWIISVDDYKPKPVKQRAPHKAVVHGPPRPFHAFRKGKGGQETRPPYYVLGDRKPNVSLAVGDLKAEAQRREILNLVAHTAHKHGMAIPAMPNPKLHTVAQNVEALRKEVAKANAREEAKAKEQAEREALRAKAAQSAAYVLCGSCAKVISALLPVDKYKQHADGCKVKAELFRDFIARSERIQNLRERAKVLAALKDDAEAPLTKDQLANEFNASDLAIITAKEQRVRYINAATYSDAHK